MSDLKKGEGLLQMIDLIKSGYAGVLPNGSIVDRRIHNDAIPIAKNSMFRTPEPRKVE